MIIKISKAAQLYFVLLELSDKQLSFTTAYRIKRNLDRLKTIGEKYSEELNLEFQRIFQVKEDHQDTDIKHYSDLADMTVFNRWEESGEEDEFDLKILQLEGEDVKFTARQIEILEPILIFE